MTSTLWKHCSVCKGPIPFGGTYYRCSVSTCNLTRRTLVFCSMDCWDAHLPDANHRRPYGIEEIAPKA